MAAGITDILPSNWQLAHKGEMLMNGMIFIYRVFDLGNAFLFLQLNQVRIDRKKPEGHGPPTPPTRKRKKVQKGN